MLPTAFAFVCVALVALPDQQPDKQLVVTISGTDLRGGVVSEVTWDGGTLLLQGVFAEPGGALKPQYFVVPADRITLLKRDEQTDESLKYWQMKSNRVSPTGLGRITSKVDTKMPQFGVGNLERRLGDAVNMGGTQTKTTLHLARVAAPRTRRAGTLRRRNVVVVAAGAESYRLHRRQG